MVQYVFRRLVSLVPVLVGVSLLVFVLTNVIPGDVVMVMLGAQPDVTAEQLEHMRETLGLNKPVAGRYLSWLGSILRGDWGVSLRSGRDVLRDIVARFSVTLELAATATFISVIIGVPLGILSASHQNRLGDLIFRLLGLLGISVPSFWLGTILIIVSSIYFGYLPSVTFVPLLRDPWGNLQIIIFPAVSLASGMAAVSMRMTRSSMLEVLRQDYIRTARAKGLHDRLVLYKHALRNALIPVTTVVGLQFGVLLGGVVVVEELFCLPGLGRFLLSSIYQRDYPVIQGCVLFIACAFCLINMIVDILYGILDPRIRYSS